MLKTDTPKYPSEIIEAVKKTLRKDLIKKRSDTELVDQIEALTKAEVMDKYLDSYGERISSSEIWRVVYQIFGFDLDTKSVLSKEKVEISSSIKMDTSISPSKVVIDSYLDQHGKKVTGADIRIMINEIFGINLDAISSLEKARISLFSKDQWVVHHDKDLFVVHTGDGDIDVWVFPTDYFIEQTGIGELPKDLQHSLKVLGYSYNVKIGSYYYANPTGEAVPDAFKGQTIGAIVKVIHHLYSHL